MVEKSNQVEEPATAEADERWYAVHCRAHKERHAAALLSEGLLLATYVPEVRGRVRSSARRTLLFPGYIFVRADLGKAAMSGINTTPGVLRLVSFGGVAPHIPEPAMRALHEQVVRFNAAGGLPEHTFQPGETLRLKRGPLMGLEAVFVEPMQPGERVRVLISFLGCLREAQLDRDSLERVPAAAPARRQRRTRGRGRPIQRSEAV